MSCSRCCSYAGRWAAGHCEIVLTMHFFKTILTASLGVLLALPAGAASSGAVFCIEADGSVSLEGTGCDCASERGGHSVGHGGELEVSEETNAVDAADEQCKPCVDIPLLGGYERLSQRAHRADGPIGKISAPAFLSVVDGAGLEASSSAASPRIVCVPCLAHSGSIPLRI